MNTSRRYSPEVRDRAVRMVLEQQKEHSSQWAAIQSIAAKLGCTSETLRRWVRQTEYDQGTRAGMTSDDRDRLKKLERENRELKRANEMINPMVTAQSKINLNDRWQVVIRYTRIGKYEIPRTIEGS